MTKISDVTCAACGYDALYWDPESGAVVHEEAVLGGQVVVLSACDVRQPNSDPVSMVAPKPCTEHLRCIAARKGVSL